MITRDDLMTWATAAYRRGWPAALTVLLPIMFAFVAIHLSVEYLMKDVNWADVTNFEIKKEGLDRFTRDVAGRYQYAVTIAFLRATAVAALILAVVVVARTISPIWGPSIITIVVATIVVIYLSAPSLESAGDERTSHIWKLLNAVFHAGEKNGIVGKIIRQRTDQSIRLNIAAASIGFWSLLVAFASLSVRRPNGQDVSQLKRRRRELELTTVASGAILVMLTAINKVLISWPQALLTEMSQKAYEPLATAIANYWGAFGTGVLICAAPGIDVLSKLFH